jgi:hypothetical protein
MAIVGPASRSIGIKAERGFIAEAYAARSEAFVIGLLPSLTAVDVKAGQETAVVVDVPKLSPHANVGKITATLTVVDDGQTGAQQTTSVGITEGKEPQRTVQVSVDVVPGIRNAQIRLLGGAVFWTHSGAVPAGAYAIPDFSAQVNAYLDKYQSQDGNVALQFMVKSDTDGSVSIAIEDVESSLLQTQSWKNDLDSTFRVDRILKVTFNQVMQLPIDPVNPPSGKASVSTVRLDADGQFGADRLLGAVEMHDGRNSATVSQDFSIAQGVTPVKELLKKAIQCTGVAGYFEADDQAELYVELQNEQSSAPMSGAPLAKANLKFSPPEKHDTQPWTFAKFEKPAELKPDTPYWIVVKGVRGSLRLGLRTPISATSDPVPVTRGGLLLNRGGQIWKSFGGPAAPPLEALLSLVYVPEPDNQTAATEISIAGGGPSQRFDPQSVAKTLTFPFSDAAAPVLIIESRALGSLTIANVIQEYTVS